VAETGKLIRTNLFEPATDLVLLG